MTEFERKLKKFNIFHLLLTVVGGAVLIAAIVTAICVKVTTGIIIGICVCVAYTLLLNGIIEGMFGVSYRRVSGGIALTVIRSKKDLDTCRRLPCRLMGQNVVAIDGRGKQDKADTRVETLIIPATVRHIEENAFEGMTSLCHIVFEGDAHMWDGVTHGDLDTLQVEFAKEDTHEDMKV